MRDDLLKANAPVRWAEAQIPTLNKRIEEWTRNKPYSIRIDTDSAHGKKVYRLCNIVPIPAIINAEAGIIVHAIRSSLDLLAYRLAERNGAMGCKDVYFPVCRDLAEFEKPGKHGGKHKIRRLSAADQAVIERLRPYQGGNNLLFALHSMDSKRKHRELVEAGTFTRGVGVSSFSLVRGMVRNGGMIWKGFENEAVIAVTPISEPDGQIDLGLFISLKEGGPVKGHQLPHAIGQFIRLADSIFELF